MSTSVPTSNDATPLARGVESKCRSPYTKLLLALALIHGTNGEIEGGRRWIVMWEVDLVLVWWWFYVVKMCMWRSLYFSLEGSMGCGSKYGCIGWENGVKTLKIVKIRLQGSKIDLRGLRSILGALSLNSSWSPVCILVITSCSELRLGWSLCPRIANSNIYNLLRGRFSKLWIY